MNDQKTTMSVLKPLSLAVALATTGSAHALEYDFYGSLRIHGEMVEPDVQTSLKTTGGGTFDEGLDSYAGLRDAYSRIGFNATHQVNDTTTFYAKLELPFDSANLAVQDPWDQDADIRVGKVGLKGSLGDIAFGQMWLPYYNAIAYSVDMFSSYYSGFATHTTFRKGDTITYYSPTYAGFSVGASYSADGAGYNGDDRWQATVSYGFDNVTVSGGIDVPGGDFDTDILGASLMWQATSALYVGAKYEVFQNDATWDGNVSMNAYAGYTMGKNTLKAMIAETEGYGEQSFHLGVDHQFSDDLMFFAEYYSEETTAAITSKNDGISCIPNAGFAGESSPGAGDNIGCNHSGGDAIVLGLRYDFGAP